MRAIACSLGFVLFAAPAFAQQVPTFGAETRAVEVDVLVTRDGRAVPGLAATDFELFDDGVKQEVEVAAGPGAPVNALLVLDTSISLAGERLTQLKTAAGALLDGLHAGDHGTLITFSQQTQLASPATTDVNALRAALAAAPLGGGASALHDAVFAALQLADRRNGRPVLMVFSDGEDRASWLEADDLKRAARTADVVIYAAGLQPPQATDTGGVAYMADPRGESSRRASDNTGFGLGGTDAGRGNSEQRSKHGNTRIANALDDLTDMSGGRVWAAENAVQLRQAFLDLLDEVRGRYLLRFEPTSQGKKGWHKLEVRLKTRGQVRARRGYSY